MSSVSFNLKQFLGFSCHDIGIFKEMSQTVGHMQSFNKIEIISIIVTLFLLFRLALNFHYFQVSLIVLSVIILGCCIMSFIFISLAVAERFYCF